MAHLLSSEYRLRVDFSSEKKRFTMPELLETQINSYKRFLQLDVAQEKRENIGLEAIFRQFFNIENEKSSWSLKYLGYTIEKPKYSVKDCLERSLSYAGALQVRLRLNLWDVDPDTGNRTGIKVAKEQNVYILNVPFVTENGSFVMNGVERVFVMQLHRSPGVVFKRIKSEEALSEDLFLAQAIPEHGSWLEFETTRKNICYVKIDKRKRFPAGILLNAIGLSNTEILERFYKVVSIKNQEGKLFANGDVKGLVLEEDLIVNGKVMAKAGSRITRKLVKTVNDPNLYYPVADASIYGNCALRDIVLDEQISIEAGDIITPETLVLLKESGTDFDIALVKDEKQLVLNSINVAKTMIKKLKSSIGSDISYEDLANIFIYHNQRPGEPVSSEEAKAFLTNLFFEGPSYDLSIYGRIKVNRRLGLDVSLDNTHLSVEDIVKIIEYLVLLINGSGFLDDIDSLANRRIRRIDEMLGVQLKSAMLAMQKNIKDKMGFLDAETASPSTLINANVFASVFKSFFESNQLSQFLDQINPLSEVSHKRRISSLGTGGLTRERAGFEVRDVNPSHYGRICPIETPEGPNIGLIVALSNYAKVNQYGFIETPYRKVVKGVLTDEIVFLSYADEHDKVICTAKARHEGRRLVGNIEARKNGEVILTTPENVDYMDISPQQILGVSASSIPFVEHDDANRALMGCNMQRQAVPLVKPSSPLVGTGMESVVARSSGRMLRAKRAGEVVYVDSSMIVIRTDDNLLYDVDVYRLDQYTRSNQNTVFVNVPIVKKYQRVEKGQAIANGPSTDKGDLALGQDLTVAFMPWRGYNYEDAITISERVVKEDLMSSIRMETYECIEHDTKLGPEEFTSDVPNVAKELLSNLDDSGIVRVGAYVKPGDILVGKVTPKVETSYSPEEKLFQAIFGEKAKNVSDSSLKVPPGVRGIVTDVKIFVRRGVDKGEKRLELEEHEKKKERALLERKKKIIHDLASLSVASIADGLVAANSIKRRGEYLIKSGDIITKQKVGELKYSELSHLSVADESSNEKIKSTLNHYSRMIDAAEATYQRNVSSIEATEELSTGVLRIAKITLAIKRHLQVGDKLAGRHGNKGVVSRILPEEDLPFMADGTPVDIVLNPLGVPSRMNAGQILEAHLGMAAKGIGRLIDDAIKRYDLGRIKNIMLSAVPDADSDTKNYIESLSDNELLMYAEDWRHGAFMATPAFDGASEKDIDKLMKVAGIPPDGKYTLYDGLTGEPFDQKIMVGVMHILKLDHMVDDKVHSRSVGPYSLVTQQPLGGKAQFGGQRFGEMEVWTLEGYGAAYNLQEVLTLKSDDIEGRSKAYEAIVKGKPVPLGGLPESFNVLVKELQSLGLSVELLKETK